MELAADGVRARLIQSIPRWDLLAERHRLILEFRYGLRDGVPHTILETAKHFKVSRDRVHQIERKAIRILDGSLDP